MSAHDDIFIMAVHNGIQVPLAHAEYKHQHIVSWDITSGVAHLMADLGMPFEPPEGRTMHPFLNGIKIGGREIAGRNTDTGELTDEHGDRLGLYRDIGVVRLPSGGVHQVSLLSTNLDVTDADDVPLRTVVDVIPNASAAATIVSWTGGPGPSRRHELN